ncbi:polymeric immunoglobulin receptor-like protein [Labeo rohita]|nr:polymeric immunoglobulin receptor-like protein [Labeo rohita]
MVLSTRCLNDHSIEDIYLDQTMKIIQLQIFLLMWAQVTESLTNIVVTLGADVNISCDLDIDDIYWYKHKSPDPPVQILRTYDSISEGVKYENSIFKHKYSVKTNSRLFIRNISTDELGVYYCVKTSEPLKFSNGTKIYISGLVIRYLQATRKCKNISNNPQTTTAVQHSEDTQRLCCFTSSDHDDKWGKGSVEEQHPKYKNRAESVAKQYQKGDFSLKLKNLQYNDTGNYQCYITAESEVETVELLIEEPLQVLTERSVGSSVVLPCSSRRSELTAEDITVHWTHDKTLKVYDIIKGKVSLEEQDSAYANRTEINRENYLKGDFALKLNNLQRNDMGNYTCEITNELLIQNVKLGSGKPRIVLLGKTGSGKTSTAEIIVGRKCFTNTYEKQEVCVDGKKMQIIDTPGLIDGPEEKIKDEIEKLIFMSDPGPHVFLLVIKLPEIFREDNNIDFPHKTGFVTGLYYCVTKDSPPKYSNGTRLHITEPTLNLDSKNNTVGNHTVVKCIEKDQPHWLIILISAVFNGVLIIVIIGLVKVFVLGSKRTRDNLKRSQDPHLQQPQVLDLEQPQILSQVQQQTTNTVEEPLDLIPLSLDERIYVKMRNDRETSREIKHSFIHSDARVY